MWRVGQEQEQKGEAGFWEGKGNVDKPEERGI